MCKLRTLATVTNLIYHTPMTTKTKPGKSSATTITRWLKAYKTLAMIIFVILLFVSIAVIVKYTNYISKFSDKDFAAISTKVEGIFKEVGGGRVYRIESCRYRAPEEFSSNRLYCGVKIATYITYHSDEQARSVAKNLEDKIDNLGQTSSYFNSFYKQPNNDYTWATVVLDRPLPKAECNFAISSGDRAKSAIHWLPERADDNLIALSFECSAESREEYFPVTYRQG